MPLAKALILTLTVGLIWQFVLVAILVAREQGTVRWSVTREALWLRSPRNPKSGRVGGRLWLVVIPLSLAFGVEGLLIPSLPHSANRDLGPFLATHNGQAFMHGAWAWYGVLLVCFLFNTVLGEELLFRGLLLPRMNRAFGRGDWGRQRPTVRRLPPPHPMGNPSDAARHLHHRLPLEALPSPGSASPSTVAKASSSPSCAYSRRCQARRALATAGYSTADLQQPNG